ncbi:hypothetical protein ES708_31980 [subsurface metagenome]
MPYLRLNFPMGGVKGYSGRADYASFYPGKDLSAIASLAPADAPDHSKSRANLKGVDLCLCPWLASKGIGGVWPGVISPGRRGGKITGKPNSIVGLEGHSSDSSRGAGAEGLKPTDNSDSIDFFKSACLDFIEVAVPKRARKVVFVNISFILIGHYIIDIFPVVGARVADFVSDSAEVAREAGAQVYFHR